METENAYLRVVEDADRNNRCVMLWCSTCQCREFRSAVKAIPDLQSVLASLDLDQFTAHKTWYNMLRITVMTGASSCGPGCLTPHSTRALPM